MSGGGLYLTLPSNSNPNTFPNNKANKYMVKLPQRVDFGLYEAAIVELQYPNSYYNAKGIMFIIEKPDGETHTVRVSDGKYDTIDELVDELNHKLRLLQVIYEAYFEYSASLMKTGIYCIKDFRITLSPQLASILGYRQRTIIEGYSLGEFHSDIDQGMTALYIYSNIAQNQIVGGSMVPLLRVVPLTGSRKDAYTNIEFKHPRFIPLKNESTDLVEIDIRRDNGEDVLFNTGKVIITLQLRPRAK